MGISFHDRPEVLEQILTDYPQIEAVQIQFNYADYDDPSVQNRECYEVCVKHHKPVIVMEPVKGGTLAKVPETVEKAFRAYHPDMSPASWAIRFAASQPGVRLVLSGMSDLAQLADNMSYMKDFKPLNAEETRIVMEAADTINSSIAIACTGCSYCTDGCPMKIAIPKYFSLYNLDMQESREKDWTSQGGYYDNYEGKFGLAGDCIKCGRCEKICPQHLPIRKYLEDVAAHFGK